MTRTPALFAAVLLLGGCPLFEEQVACTDIAMSSVTLTVTDESGAAVPDTSASYRLPGEDPVDCEGMSDDGTFVCGWEIAGPMEIVVEAPGYVTEVVEVDIEADECHVIGQAVDVVLEPLLCTDEEVPGVMVNVTDSQGALVSGGDVTWTWADADMEPLPCDPVGGTPNEWACAPEAYGPIEIWIDDAGPYEPFMATVDVMHDGCHPITETLDAVLQFLPD